MQLLETDLVIVGAGPAGLFAVFQAGLLGMACHVVDSQEACGGQPSALYPEKYIYDIPAHPKILAGDLIEKLLAQAEPYHPVYHLGDSVVSYTRSDTGLVIQTAKGKFIACKALILAVGAGSFGANRPPLDGIEGYEGHHVHYFIRQQDIFTDKDIVIAGGGDSAVDWCVALASRAKSVAMVHRRETFRAAPAMVDALHRLVADGVVRLVVPYQLAALEGDGQTLAAIIVQDTKGETIRLPANHLLAFFGLARSLGHLETWGLVVDKSTASIHVHRDTCETNLPRIYAVGDCAFYPHKLKLILTGFADVASAIHHAWAYVFPDKPFRFTHSTSLIP